MDNLSVALEWKRYAELDLMSAESFYKMRPVPIEIICYHCQQSAEKYLKGFLVLQGYNPPKTHDLDQLQKLCIPIYEQFSEIAEHCSHLTAYGVQPRYPFQIELNESDMLEALISAKKSEI
jgi:HEPN domain-containing protein